MLGHFQHEVPLAFVDGRVAELDGVVDRRQLAVGELHVDDRAQDLRDLALSHGRRLRRGLGVHRFPCLTATLARSPSLRDSHGCTPFLLSDRSKAYRPPLPGRSLPNCTYPAMLIWNRSTSVLRPAIPGMICRSFRRRLRATAGRPCSSRPAGDNKFCATRARTLRDATPGARPINQTVNERPVSPRQPNASAVETTSSSSLVMAACRARFIWSVRWLIRSEALLVADSMAVMRAPCSPATASSKAW